MPVFGVSLVRMHSVSSIQSEGKKIRIRKTPNTDTSHVVYVSNFARSMGDCFDIYNHGKWQVSN